MLVRGGLVSLEAGEVDTDDEQLIAALSGALDVERLEEKPKRKAKNEEGAE